MMAKSMAARFGAAAFARVALVAAVLCTVAMSALGKFSQTIHEIRV